jgi:hypothetical protein
MVEVELLSKPFLQMQIRQFVAFSLEFDSNLRDVSQMQWEKQDLHRTRTDVGI